MYKNRLLYKNRSYTWQTRQWAPMINKIRTSSYVYCFRGLKCIFYRFKNQNAILKNFVENRYKLILLGAHLEVAPCVRWQKVELGYGRVHKYI